MNILPTFHLLRRKVRKRAKHCALHYLQTSQSAPQRTAHSATKAEIATPDDRLECTELSSGVRREGVTEAAGALQKSGLIRYQRGHITVVDRDGLERRTCECYRVVKQEYDRLLPPTLAT